MADQPKSLIINSPYHAPTRHWGKQRRPDGSLPLFAGRRPAAYDIFDLRNNTHREVALPLVNEIRQRVDDWRAADYPGITPITRRLLEHWYDSQARDRRFYFCQLEAMETLIWWVEGAAPYRQGIVVPGDGGPWERLCSKMATGAGKTTVMAMLIAWQVLNAVTFPQRREFSRAVFIVTPGLTVKERLQVLQPGHPKNDYDEFNICPSPALRERLNQVALRIDNWHQLMPYQDPERSVRKLGPESDQAFSARMLKELARFRHLVIINDEAHHAYRAPAEIKVKRSEDFDPEEATRWIEGLDRIHRQRGILRCFDLSATPFAPTGKKNTEEALFSWVISDFGLYDAIEAGLVKTPRVVVRDDALPDAKTYRPKLFHLFNDAEVKDNLNTRAEPHEPLPQLVQAAYTILANDWKNTLDDWRKNGHTIPPVLLTVCNRIETARRIEHYFNQGDCHYPEMHAPHRTLRVDSQVLTKAESGETAKSDKVYQERLAAMIQAADIPLIRKTELLSLSKEEQLRAIVDHIGKRGMAGQDIQNVISVAMLSEGWDARNVTQIMGLRAFISQLLCEQVIGRGLRRVAYELDNDGLLLPEYVNIFGVPLPIFQDVGEGSATPPPPKPSTEIVALVERGQYEIRWPNLLRLEAVLKPTLVLDRSQVADLPLAPETTPITAELAPLLGGETDLSKITAIDLTQSAQDFRLQREIFRAARKLYERIHTPNWTGNREYLVFQLVRIVEGFIASDKLLIPSLFHQAPIHRRILIALNLDRIAEHLYRFIRLQNQERIEPVFDPDHPIGSTADLRPWSTTRPCHPARKSQISHVVFDSTWEAAEAYALERSDEVDAYAKTDHLGFHILYLFNGVARKFFPDFLIRLKNGKTLILEVKGQDNQQNQIKRDYLDAWVKTVNQHGGFGEWCWDVSRQVSDIHDILARHSAAQSPVRS